MSSGTAPSDRGASADANSTPLQWADRRGRKPPQQTSDDIVGHDGGDQDGHDAEPDHEHTEQAKEDRGRDYGKDWDKHRERNWTRHAGGDTADCVTHRQVLTGQVLTRLNFENLPSELGIFMITDSKLLRRYATILSTDA
jgi:hypothetical protein